MTNEEILDCLRNGGYAKPDPIKQANPDVFLTKDGSPTQYKQGEIEPGTPMSGKGHPCFYRGKKIDKVKFMDALASILNDRMPVYKAYKKSGLSQPTFEKRANELLRQGYLPWYLFADGQPLYLQFEDDRMNEMLKEYRKETGI